MMPNIDPRDRFVDHYLKLMIDSTSCTPMGADTSFYSHLPQIFRIYVSHFDFEVIFTFLCRRAALRQSYVTSITTSVRASVMLFDFYLTHGSESLSYTG